jgi:xanthine dehydrogenase YagS FAD-binding subunit
MNREHALFGASRCVAVSPSDTATALVALEATMVARSLGGERLIPADEFFVMPNTHITRMTALEDDEILTAVRVPAKWAGKRFYFEKVADRNVWDFALVSIATAMALENDVVNEARFVLGGVACKPWRLKSVESAVIGKPLSDESADALAGLASEGAKPLNYNHFKVLLMENLVRRALRA